MYARFEPLVESSLIRSFIRSVCRLKIYLFDYLGVYLVRCLFYVVPACWHTCMRAIKTWPKLFISGSTIDKWNLHAGSLLVVSEHDAAVRQVAEGRAGVLQQEAGEAGDGAGHVGPGAWQSLGESLRFGRFEKRHSINGNTCVGKYMAGHRWLTSTLHLSIN